MYLLTAQERLCSMEGVASFLDFILKTVSQNWWTSGEVKYLQ
jgi:hypothetical protein